MSNLLFKLVLVVSLGSRTMATRLGGLFWLAIALGGALTLLWP
jgi:hypothetical protein